MMSVPVCSIVIPTWNGRPLVDRCLRSLAVATDSDSIEIIVVDDGSTDGTADYLRSAYPGVTVLCQAANRGFGASCNAGLAQSRAPIVLLLNNDLLAEPGFLPPLLAHFTDARVFAVNPQVFQFDGSTPGGGLVRGYFHCGMLRLRWSESKKEREHGGLTLYANGAATAVDREKFLALGGFDPLYAPFYSEDLDLSYRAYRRGWEIRYEPRSRVRHEHSVTIKTAYTPDYVERISKRNRILFVWRNIRDRGLLARHVFWIALRSLGALVRLDFAFLGALREALRRFGEVRQRRRTDPPDAVTDRTILEMTARWANPPAER
jgi:GT2 family glycosyltransferase